MNTVAAYRRDTDEWFEWCDGHGYDPLAVTRIEVDRFRGWLTHHRRRGGRVSEATLARKLTSLSSFYRYVVDELDLMPRSPMRNVKRPPREDESLTAGLDLDEAQRLLAFAEKDGPLPHALIHVMLSTGVRVSEACGATTDDLGMDRGYHVLTVLRKGGKRQRLPLVPAAWDTLGAYLDGRTGPLFLATRVPLYRQEAYRIVLRVATAARIEEKRITPHSLRHTAATLALDAGVPLRLVQEMLGHRDPRTTTRYDRSRQAIDSSPVHVLGELLTT